MISTEKAGDAYDSFMNMTETSYGKKFSEFLESAVQTPPGGREYTTTEKFVIALDYHYAFVNAFPKGRKNIGLERVYRAFMEGATDTQKAQVEAQKAQIIMQPDASNAARKLFVLPLVGGASAAATETIAITYEFIAEKIVDRFGDVGGTIDASMDILARRNANNLYSQMELSAAIGALGDALLDIKGPLRAISRAIEDNKITTPSQLLDVVRFTYICTTVTKQRPTVALRRISAALKDGTFKSDAELTNFVDSMDGLFRITGKKERVGMVVGRILENAKASGIGAALEKATEEAIERNRTFDTFVYEKKKINV